MSDPDYSPAYQDEYQRLWHEAAARAEAAEAERDLLAEVAAAGNEREKQLEARVAALEEALRQIAAPENHKHGDLHPSAIARAALAAPTKEEACTGGGDCPATTHLHGCYSDDGNCDYPDHHDAAPTKEGT